MTDRAAISAQLVDVRNVGQHKSIKLTLHVPAEQAAMVMQCFGWPTMVEPVPVALARLVEGDAPVPAPLTAGPQGTPTSASANRRGEPSPDKRLAQRAGILCNDPLFHRYLEKRLDVADFDTERAAEYVREFCKVASRADIRPNTEAATRFDLLESAFICWRDAPEMADAS